MAQTGTLQIYKNGAWATYSSAQTPQVGKVVYYRWEGETETAAHTTEAVPTVGATHALAYLGALNSGTLTSAALTLVPEAFPEAAPTDPNPVIDEADGGTHIAGTMSGTAASNKAAYSQALAAKTAVDVGTVTGTTPDYDIIIEVHYRDN